MKDFLVATAAFQYLGLALRKSIFDREKEGMSVEQNFAF